MDYKVSIINENEEEIESHTIEIENEKDIDKILGKKTHRACVNGEWTQPKYTTIITKKEDYGRTDIIGQSEEQPTSEHKHLY